jgi:putative SbcD/Mre11-related phosphoesterase
VSRRLFHWLRFADPQHPLLRQAQREMRDESCASPTALSFLLSLEGEPIRLRFLAEPSPFTSDWLPGSATASHSPLADAVPLPVTSCVVHHDWLLTPFRAIIHLPTETAVVADLHLGYDRTRQAGGDAVPERGWTTLRRRLTALLDRHSIRRLVIAGDLVEDSRHAQAARDFVAWLISRSIEPHLVPGNHDRGWAPIRGLICHTAGFRLGDWMIQHEEAVNAEWPQIVGHMHPIVRMPEARPCYLISRSRMVLPASSDDAAGGNIKRMGLRRDDECYAIASAEVLALGPVRLLREQRTHATRQLVHLATALKTDRNDA